MSVLKAYPVAWRPSSAGGALGRNVEHDGRSRAFAVTAAPAELGPVWHLRHGSILHQRVGSCTGHALTGALMTHPLYRSRHNYGERTALNLYMRATVIDSFPGSYPPDDTGTSGLAVCKAAVERKLLSGYEHAFGIDQALAALQRGPVITGIDWWSGFDKPVLSTGLVRVGGYKRGAHEVVVRGYDPGGESAWGIGGTEPTVLCDNSWGRDWGRSGSFVMTVADWALLLDADGDVTCPIRTEAP